MMNKKGCKYAVGFIIQMFSLHHVFLNNIESRKTNTNEYLSIYKKYKWIVEI